MMEDSIHGLEEYKNFHYTFTFSTVLAALPSVYMPPTIAVMYKIISTYLNTKTPPMDRHIFICISLNFFCICPKIMAVFLPLLFIIPFGCTAFMIPAVGYCRTMGHPLKFGAVYIYYSGGWSGWRNSYIHLSMSVIMCTLTLLCTSLMLLKLRETSSDATISNQTKKSSTRAEKSLTITIIAAMIPFINNTLLTIVYLTLPDYVFYFIIIRPFGNDIETCMMPWILYLTHPMFKNHARRSSAASTISVVLPKTNTF